MTAAARARQIIELSQQAESGQALDHAQAEGGTTTSATGECKSYERPVCRRRPFLAAPEPHSTRCSDLLQLCVQDLVKGQRPRLEMRFAASLTSQLHLSFTSLGW